MSLYEVTGMMRAIKKQDGPPEPPPVDDAQWSDFESAIADVSARAKKA